LSRGPVRAVPLLVVLFGPVQVDEYRQGPRAHGEREPDQNGKNDPLVPVAPGGVGVGRADGVAVPGLTVHLGTGVPIDGVVADQEDRTGGDQVVE
jgi:hypothetical protein